jgi:16S rRNA G966 N2-methylase RsmD
MGKEAIVKNYDFSMCLDTLLGQFDLIFIDPPYCLEYGKTALEKIAKKRLLSENGIAVYERDCPFEGEVDGLEKFDERRYGKAFLTFFKNGEKV